MKLFVIPGCPGMTESAATLQIAIDGIRAVTSERIATLPAGLLLHLRADFVANTSSGVSQWRFEYTPFAPKVVRRGSNS